MKSVRSRILKLRNQYIFCSNRGQLVHSNSDSLPLHHRLYRNPAFFLKRIDGRCTLSRSNIAGSINLSAFDVVCAQDESLRSCQRLVSPSRISKKHYSLMTPLILAVIKSTSSGSEGCFDFMRIALEG